MYARQVTGNEFWLRCVFCGDSQHSNKKSHFSVNLATGQYFCYRCSEGGRLPIKVVLQLIEEAGIDPFSVIPQPPELSLEDALERVQPGALSSRFSALPRFHLSNFRERDWDAFMMYGRSLSSVIGVLLRSVSGDKSSYIIGRRGILCGPETHFSDNFIRVVEGPYDVLSHDDVGVSGTFSALKLKDYLPGKFIILCPDGDVWTEAHLQKFFATTVQSLFRSSTGPWPCSIEFLKDGLDPDEVPVQDRLSIDPKDFLYYARKKKILSAPKELTREKENPRHNPGRAGGWR